MFITTEDRIKSLVAECMHQIDVAVSPESIATNRTDEHIEGDVTVLVFPLAKKAGKGVEETCTYIGDYCKQHADWIQDYQIVKGFLNFTMKDHHWMRFVAEHYDKPYWQQTPKQNKMVVEFSSPNTNKPLHLGHLRNNFIGEAISKMLNACGYDVHKTCVVNDRGIHICKSMLAWQLFGKEATPQSACVKGDHFVGDYYVLFEQSLKQETTQLLQEIETTGTKQITNPQERETIEQLLSAIHQESNEEKKTALRAKLNEALRNATPLMQQVRTMLQQWEQGNPDILQLWKTMNDWVYDGFAQTYTTIGTSFDSVDYESQCYQLGKSFVLQGLEDQILYQKEDGSIWVDLSAFKLDQKLLLRKDQTSVYITQDMGLVQQRYDKLQFDTCIYVVGNEQDYHFNVLKSIAQKMGLPYADKIFHLSYGMVELPSGKMKSREGTVVDADELIEKMNHIAKETTLQLGKTDTMSEQQVEQLYRQIAMAAIKFYLLRVQPAKKMLFNPEESIDLHGFTGPFVQYTHARIASVLRQYGQKITHRFSPTNTVPLEPLEKKIILHLEEFPQILLQATRSYDPSLIATYGFYLAKKFNGFYNQHSILKAETEEKKQLRLAIAVMTQECIKTVLHLLGIDAPEKM